MAAHSLGLSDPISICFAELYTGGRGEAPAAAGSVSPEIDVSDYVKLDDFSCLTVAAGESQNPAFPDEANCGMVKRKRVEGRIGFRTRSDVEILDDGFKWRKYGKKSVKNSPNPRNYYRCSSQGCMVKKRVERDRIDPSYVITTYEGKHDHESPNLRHQSYIDSSSWGSCAHAMPAGAPIHSCNGLFAPFSYN